MGTPNAGRLSKIKHAVKHRQPDLTIILENVHDLHNVGAVLRSAESIGLIEIYVLFTHDHLKKHKMKLGKRTSSGARKWVDVLLYNDAEQCFKKVKEKYPNVLGAFLGTDSTSLYEMNLSQPTALLFGNEHEGITQESLKHCTGLFHIPQFGMTQSLNISVACAISLYEACRQRIAANLYESHPNWGEKEQVNLLENYTERHTSGYKAHVAYEQKD